MELTAEVIGSLARKLVAIPSVNPSLAATGETGTGEAAIAAFCRDWMAASGLKSQIEECAPGRFNAVGECGRGEGPTLVLCAHIDTVARGEASDPHIQDGRLHGRGAYDMKGSAAVMMAVGAALARRNLRGRLLLALVADEEHASLGAQHFVGQHRADYCIVTEPSELQLVLAHKGFVWLEIVAQGTAAHGSRWDLGDSAIARMGRIVAALDEQDRSTLRARRHPLLGPGSQHCGRIAGGTGLSTYAESCRVELERRTLPGETVEQVLAQTQAAIAGCGERAEVRLLMERSPLECGRDSAVASAVRTAATAELGRAPAEIGVGYWMDAAIFAAAGIPTVNIGPTGAGAHAAEEWVELDSLAVCARILAAAAEQLCG